MTRHKMRMTSSVTYTAHGCGDCDYSVSKEQRDAGLDPMALLDAHAAAFPEHIVVVEEMTRRNYVSKMNPKRHGIVVTAPGAR
jgi:hypothetical protein